jgi:hypothetical protein
MDKTKITKERFIKRKTVLKLAAFVLFGICLLNSQKAGATVESRQSLAQEG